MPDIEVFMDDVPREYSAIPENMIVLLAVKKCELGKTGENARHPGEPQLKVELDVKAPDEWVGKTVYENLLLPMKPTPLDTPGVRREKAERGVRLRLFMESFQVPWGPAGFNRADFIGARAGGITKLDKDLDGKPQTRIKKYMLEDEAKAAIAAAAAVDATIDADIRGNGSSELEKTAGAL